MAIFCPITKRKVIYLTCMDCETRVCKGETDLAENQETLNNEKENLECSITKKEKKKE